MKIDKKVIKLAVYIFLVCSFALNAQESHLKIDIVGKGKPVILLPGFGCPGEVWNETVAVLKETCECHLVSYPGFNGLAAVETPWFATVEKELIDYINNSLKEAPIGIGHSVGGVFLLKMCSTNENLFSELIIVDALPCFTAVTMPNIDPATITYDSPQNQSMLNMPEEQFKGMTSGMAMYMTANKEKQELMKEWFSKVDRKTWIYGYTDLLRVDLRNDIANIKVPVSILTAINQGTPGAEKNIDEQYKKLTQKTIYFAENSLHFIMFDKTEWFQKTITNILK